MYIAVIEPGSYLDFAALVPFNGPEGLAELGLLNENGRLSGRAQSAVRPLATTDFNRIIRLGLAESDGTLPRLGAPTQGRGFSEIQDPFASDANCDRVSQLVSRLVRDRVFRKAVLRAYDSRCAVTGLRLINGGGRAEVQAAHIKPVEASGPDTIGNGLALSGTVHWMFDRGLISVSNDWKIMVSRHLNDADNIRSIMNKSGYLLLPLRESDRPRPAFIQWHQQHCFKG
jgi:putative restriction endonuclease